MWRDQKILFLILIIGFSLIAASKLFKHGFYTSHDGEGHIIRMEEFDQAFMDGQIPVRIAKRINYGLGYPFFNFNYPLVYYLGEVIHLLGFSFISSFKLLMLFSIILSGVGMYLFTRRIFSPISAFTSAVFYIFAPYRFLDIYVRGSLAESIGLAIVPFVFLWIEKLLAIDKNRKYSGILIISILILSHNITAVITLFLSISYFLFRLITVRKYRKNARNYFTELIIIFISATLITMFFWLPVVVESKQTKLIELKEDYRNNFVGARELIYSPWGFGQWKMGRYPGKMSPQIGLIHQLSAILVIVILFIRSAVFKIVSKREKISLFWISVVLVAFFLSTVYSRFLWDGVTFLQYIQLPWRFVAYIAFGLSIVAGFFINFLNSLQRLQIFLVAIFISLLVYANRNHIRINMSVDYQSPFETSEIYGPSTTSKDEHMPRFAPRIYHPPDPDGDVVPESAGVSKRIIWRSNYHKYKLDFKKSAEFRPNVSYFPGWRAEIDGRKTKILWRKDEYKRIRVIIPKGKHKVELFFSETWYRLIADIISLGTVLFFYIYFLGTNLNRLTCLLKRIEKLKLF